MSKFFVFAAFLLCSTVPFSNAAALPKGITGVDIVPPEVFPDVIPGPGLPSLAELGVTSKELYTMPRNLLAPPIPEDSPLTKRGKQFTPGCGGGIGDTAKVDDVIACFNYFVKIGNNLCIVVADNEQHLQCQAGSARIYAVDQGMWPFASTAL
ncbi:hypothetical protein MMC30_006126 [Trapelia coarctata]|nr:hypothetical protein [Trapelia coarctata]